HRTAFQNTDHCEHQRMARKIGKAMLFKLCEESTWLDLCAVALCKSRDEPLRVGPSEGRYLKVRSFHIVDTIEAAARKQKGPELERGVLTERFSNYLAIVGRNLVHAIHEKDKRHAFLGKLSLR